MRQDEASVARPNGKTSRPTTRRRRRASGLWGCAVAALPKRHRARRKSRLQSAPGGWRGGGGGVDCGGKGRGILGGWVLGSRGTVIRKENQIGREGATKRILLGRGWRPPNKPPWQRQRFTCRRLAWSPYLDAPTESVPRASLASSSGSTVKSSSPPPRYRRASSTRCSRYMRSAAVRLASPKWPQGWGWAGGG